MSKITSREYKIMLDHRIFATRKASLRAFWKDLKRISVRCGAAIEGTFDTVEKRTIQFLDTEDFTFRRNRLILRLRQSADAEAKGEYSLKCRTEDRYMADGKDLRPATGWDGVRKFEEDIASPFRSRFAHSVIIKNVEFKQPRTVSEAARLFPVLGNLPRDGAICDGSTPLVVVNGFTAHERVFKGPTLSLASSCDATIAVILWSHTWKGRAVSAEFSFRYSDKEEKYPSEVAESAFDLFAALQSLDWCVPAGTTKTQFAYGQK